MIYTDVPIIQKEAHLLNKGAVPVTVLGLARYLEACGPVECDHDAPQRRRLVALLVSENFP